jgi:3-hydroxyacyl-[acyl-carrier-protein] dehydratase
LKFVLVDRISELESGKRIVAHKALSLAEEYLADHFPTFPVLPGVFMLEALVQASAWVVREALDFRPSLVVLKDARNVTYKSFVAPGQILTLTAECKELTEGQSVFQASGSVNGRETVKGKLTLRHLTLGDQDAELAAVDEQIRREMRLRYRLIAPAAAVSLAGGA